jgi:hypothetical protein
VDAARPTFEEGPIAGLAQPDLLGMLHFVREAESFPDLEWTVSRC